MTPERWKQIESVFEQALEVPGENRVEFLKNNCNGDDELRREVESLLSSHAQAGSFIDKRSLFFSDEEVGENSEILSPGELIGSYRILHEIGRGGMGAVYLAERADQQYEKQVAIKLIKRGMDTHAVLRHFRNERQILASFDHPNIARLFDGGTTDDGLPYFIMEYVEGVPIDQYCATHSISVVERLKLFCEVCAAVSYAHRHTVIHRDIKMSNILVTGEGRPKLLDFGIAKILQPGVGPEVLMTMTGVRPMTPEYASPEQVRGEPVTTASDVYSLGVVLYELLTGRSPYRFASRSPSDVAREITDTEPPRPSTVVSSSNQPSEVSNQRLLRGDLDNIVLMALRKEPERRYQSVEQFSDDISRHLAARPVLARKDTVGYRAGKFVRRNKVATAAATLVFLSLLGGVIATTWEAQRAKAEKAQAERRFNDVRQLAHSVLFDYHDAIKDLPGATRVRERLVKDALNYLDSLAGEAAGDPGLQGELASAYERVGDVRGEPYAASLGDRRGALDSYFKSLRIREGLVTAAPHDAQSGGALAAIYQKIGNALLDTDDAARALDYLQKALAISSSLADEQSGQLESQRRLAGIHNDIGLALEERGDMAGALEHHRKATVLREQLLASNPRDPEARRDVSISYVNTGRALYFSGDIPGAIAINRKGIELREALVAQDPANADYRRLLAIGYQNDGDYRAQSGDINGALESFERKIALDQRSLAADPDNVQAQGDYSYSSERIGVLLLQLENYAAALPHLHNNLSVREKMAAQDPQSLVWPYAICLAHGEIALGQAHLGDTSAAIQEYNKGLDFIQDRPVDPANMYLRGLQAQAYGWLGRTQTELARSAPSAQAKQHLKTAREMFQRSLEIWQDLRARGTLAADDVPKMEATVREIDKCDAALAEKSNLPAQLLSK